MNDFDDIISGLKLAEDLKKQIIAEKKKADAKAARLILLAQRKEVAEKEAKVKAEKLERERLWAEQKAKQDQVRLLANEAMAKLNEAEALAEKLGVSFDFDVAYGMGGTYYPTTGSEKRYDNETGWVSSSANC